MLACLTMHNLGMSSFKNTLTFVNVTIWSPFLSSKQNTTLTGKEIEISDGFGSAMDGGGGGSAREGSGDGSAQRRWRHICAGRRRRWVQEVTAMAVDC
jgi:hypothetical protein